MVQFLRYTDYGTTLVFGEAGNHHFLAMRVSLHSEPRIKCRKSRQFEILRAYQSPYFLVGLLIYCNTSELFNILC